MGFIDKIAQSVSKAMEIARPPAAAIPTILLICEALKRPGLSAIALATAVIRRLGEAGIITAAMPDGTANKICKFVRIFSEEIVSEIKMNGAVMGGTGAGESVSFGVGGNAAGTVAITSSNIMPTPFYGITY